MTWTLFLLFAGIGVIIFEQKRIAKMSENVSAPPAPAPVISIKETGFANLDRWRGLVHKIFTERELDPALGFAIMWKESSGNPLSTKDEPPVNGIRRKSIGLFQVLNTTAREIESGISEESMFNPEISARLGSRIIKKLKERYNGNREFIIAGYNAGSALRFFNGAVIFADNGRHFSDTWMGVPAKSHPDYQEGKFVNQKYVESVLDHFRTVKP